MADDARVVTARQYVALHYYYVEGWSYRRVGKMLGVESSSCYHLIRRGKQAILKAVSERGANSLPDVTALLAPSPKSSVTRDLGIAASRREELLDALERRMAQREADVAEIEECMAGDSFSPTRTKRNSYDQWEVRYLATHGGEPLPTSAYDARRAAESCACDNSECPLCCERCRYTSSRTG